MRWGLVTWSLGALLMQPAMVLAQTPGAPPKMENVDVAAVLGRSATDHSSEAEFYDSWFDTWSFGLAAGYYWTDHRKTEFGFSWTGEPHEAEASFVATGGYIDRAVRRQTASVVQVHQFFRNATFHPFVGAGVDVHWDRWLKTTVEYGQNGPTRSMTEQFTRVSARPVALLGFKAYVGERSFVRGEVSANVWPNAGSVVFRIGGGVDF